EIAPEPAPRVIAGAGDRSWQTVVRPSGRVRPTTGAQAPPPPASDRPPARFRRGDMTAPTRPHAHGERDDFEPVYHQYGPHRAGLPPLVPYFRELWARREFASEMSKASLRGADVNTVFGQMWLIL